MKVFSIILNQWILSRLLLSSCPFAASGKEDSKWHSISSTTSAQQEQQVPLKSVNSNIVTRPTTRLRSLGQQDQNLNNNLFSGSNFAGPTARTCAGDSRINCDGFGRTIALCHFGGRNLDTYETKCLPERRVNQYLKRYPRDYCGLCKDMKADVCSGGSGTFGDDDDDNGDDDDNNASPSCVNAIRNFNLIDVGVSPPRFYNLTDGIAITDAVGPFNIQANPQDKLCTGSVRLDFVDPTRENDVTGLCERNRPYTVFGDPGTSDLENDEAQYGVQAVRLTDNTYRIIGLPWTEDDCSSGAPGDELSITFTLCDNRVESFTLIDVGVEPRQSYALTQGILISAAVGPFNLRVNSVNDNCTRSMAMGIADSSGDPVDTYRCDNFRPYTVFGDPGRSNLGDGGANYERNAKQLSADFYTVAAVPWTGIDCSEGNEGNGEAMQFSICTNSVSGFRLVDTGVNPQRVEPLNSGDTLTVVGPLNMVALPTSPRCTGSMFLELRDGRGTLVGNSRCENNRPYTVFGDPGTSDLLIDETNFAARARNLPSGNYTLTATPWTGDDCSSGAAGEEKVVRFSLCDNHIDDFTIIDVGVSPKRFYPVNPGVPITVSGLMNLQANPINTACTESAQLALYSETDGRVVASRCANFRPYTLYDHLARVDEPNSQAGYDENAKQISSGFYNITATPYNGKDCNQGRGEPGTPKEVRFNICNNAIYRFALIDVGVMPWLEYYLTQSGTSFPAIEGPVNIRADQLNTRCTTSVQLILVDEQRTISRCVNQFPYTIFGDDSRPEDGAQYNVRARNLNGRYTIKAIPWTGRDCVNGASGGELELTFNL